MHLNHILRIAALTMLASTTASSQPADPIPGEIRTAVQARVDNTYNRGIIIGVLDRGGTHYYSYGHGSAAADSTG